MSHAFLLSMYGSKESIAGSCDGVLFQLQPLLMSAKGFNIIFEVRARYQINIQAF
jgi:hypothetical protein